MVASAENTLRFEADASLGVGIDLPGKMKTAQHRLSPSADKVKVFREVREETVALTVPIEAIEDFEIEPPVLA